MIVPYKNSDNEKTIFIMNILNILKYTFLIYQSINLKNISNIKYINKILF